MSRGLYPKRRSAGSRRGRIGVLITLIGLATAGCDTLSSPTASISSPRGETVAFESIDGLPEPTFRKLVRDLTEEANARQVVVLSREGAAQYRIRGYASAHVQGKRTTIAWVWDVYDADLNRALRIAGEEHAEGAQRGWAAADDQTLRRIAQDGMSQLATFLSAPQAPTAPSPAPHPAEESGTVVAAAHDDFSPESSGIFRFFRGLAPDSAKAETADSASASAAPLEGPVPMPRRRPRDLGTTKHAALAD